MGAAQPALSADFPPPLQYRHFGEKKALFGPLRFGEKKGSVPPPLNSPTQIISSFYFILPMEEEGGGGERKAEGERGGC